MISELRQRGFGPKVGRPPSIEYTLPRDEVANYNRVLCRNAELTNGRVRRRGVRHRRHRHLRRRCAPALR
jgi:hypothetical protein